MISINKEPEISVGILTGKKINFELYGDFKITGVKDTLSGRLTAEFTGSNILISRGQETFTFENEAVFSPSEPGLESFLIRDVVIGVNFHWERKEKQRFTGKLKLLVNDGKITAINIVSAEAYLVSVISSEMNAKSELQLLKAHAVISRSWLFAHLEKKEKKKTGKKIGKDKINSGKELITWYGGDNHTLFDVCADDHCQRYQGITKIFTESARKAVEKTRGIVLAYDDDICDTRYSKSCGGITEAFENVWEPEKSGYLKPVVDYKYPHDTYNTDFSDERNAEKWIKGSPPAYCNTRERKILSRILPDFDQETKNFYRWHVEYSQDELKEIIKAKTGDDFGNIIDLEPLERGNSARLIKLKITGSLKTLIIGKELEIRRVLSPSHLYSSAIIIQKEGNTNGFPEKFIIYGAGWGHGVGLCQIGAAVMADKGHQFDEILSHYFSRTNLKKLY